MLHPVGGLARSCTQFEGWLLIDFSDDWNTSQAPFFPALLIPRCACNLEMGIVSLLFPVADHLICLCFLTLIHDGLAIILQGAAFEAEERLKLAHLEFSDKSNTMVEKLAALEEQLEQIKVDKKGLEAKHVLTLRGLETRHGEKEQELQRKHLAEWGELHSAKQELEARHEEISGQKTGLEERVSELEREKEELSEALAAERKRFADQVSGEKQQYEEKIESLEAEMASVTAQLNESLRVETQMAREYAEKEKALQEEVMKLEERVKELTTEVGEHVRTKEAVQKMWDDSEVSGKEGAEKIRALQLQLDESLLEMKYKVEECEELNARIEELHSLVEDSQAQADEYKQQTEEVSAEVASRDGTLKGLQAQLALVTQERDQGKEKVEKLTEEREVQLQRVKELTEEVEKLTGKLEWQQARVAELTTHVEKLTEERDSHKERAGTLLGEAEAHKSKVWLPNVSEHTEGQTRYGTARIWIFVLKGTLSSINHLIAHCVNMSSLHSIFHYRHTLSNGADCNRNTDGQLV